MKYVAQYFYLSVRDHKITVSGFPSELGQSIIILFRKLLGTDRISSFNVLIKNVNYCVSYL